ncbi:MAG: hypothetical protein KF832_09330 [Caldilineaceae bacterium]|nr:hypothetical protein [Caldilineaceae bacterium]
MWESATSELRHTCQGHTGWVRAIAFSSDGQTLASSGNDQMIRQLGASQRGAGQKLAYTP